ncbi:MAG: hypothetical protein ACTS3F_04230 [Phycisphaerales bacterium]
MRRTILSGVTAGVLACGLIGGGFGGVAMAQDAENEGMSFSPALRVGQAMSYDAEWSAVVSQTVGADASARRQAERITSKASLRLEVLEVGPEGQARVRATVPSVELVHRAGDETRQYQHPLPEDTAVIAVAWSGLGEILSRQQITFEVDATGAVGKVAGLEPFVNAAREASPELDLTGMFTPSQFVAVVQPIFDADGARDESRSKGSSWESTDTVPLGAAGVLDISNTWRFVVVEEGIATVVGTPTISVRRPVNPEPNTPTISLGDHSGYTRLGWNVEKSMLQARESMLRMTMTFGVGDVSVEQTQTVTTKLTASGE